jgi:hypothetical protein
MRRRTLKQKKVGRNRQGEMPNHEETEQPGRPEQMDGIHPFKHPDLQEAKKKISSHV